MKDCVTSVVYYTDPLCCWSWAMDPGWKKIQQEMDGLIEVEYKMGGLIPSWKHYRDTGSAISRPSQMGPEWMTAAHLSGATIDTRLWMDDPPASSYPACIAVKSVQFQSNVMAEAYLGLLWEAAMTKRINIAKTSALLRIAGELSANFPTFEPGLFQKDLLGERGKYAFRRDLQDAKYLNINRFPTLVINRESGKRFVSSGYKAPDYLRSIFGRPESG